MALSLRQASFLRALRSALGTPYVWGGTSLQKGVDCSGLVYAAALQAGLHGVPRTSQEQFARGSPVPMNGLRPGDLIFSHWGSEVGAGHVSIYIGNGKIVEAAGQGIPVRTAPLSVLQGHILGARRYLPGAGNTVGNASGFAAHQLAYYHAQQGNPQLAAAALSQVHPIQVNVPQPTLPTPVGTLQNTIGAQAQQGQAAPLPQLSTGIPTPTALSGQLGAIHDQLLKKAV